MLRLSVSTSISLNEASADGGFITRFDVLIHRYAPVRDDAEASGERVAKGDHKVEPVGRALVAIIHVGAVLESDDSLKDVLRAAGGDLKALFPVYFDDEEGWFKDEFGSAPGVDLGYVEELLIHPAWEGRNIELAVVQRVRETIAAGCKVLVMPVGSRDGIACWEELGFEVSTPEGTKPHHVHLTNDITPPRVVPLEFPRMTPEPHEEDRFKLFEDEDDEDDDDESDDSAAASPEPTPQASAGGAQGASVRRAMASRRPSRRRH